MTGVNLGYVLPLHLRSHISKIGAILGVTALLRSAHVTSAFISVGVSPHPVFLILDLSVLEVLLSHSLHPSVLLDVIPHLQVTGVCDEESVSC